MKPSHRYKLPRDMRPGAVPYGLWEELAVDDSQHCIEVGENTPISIVHSHTGEVFASVSRVEAGDGSLNLWHVITSRILRHYALVYKPYLLMC